MQGIPGEGARDSRGGSSSSELRDDTKVHPRACVLDCQVAGVELKTNRVADGPSPSPSPAGGSQQTFSSPQPSCVRLHQAAFHTKDHTHGEHIITS
ncbi:unnamed protein product [Sphagnum tenellum]